MKYLILILIVILSSNFLFANEPQRLIGNGDNYYMHPVYAPDGSKIAFTSNNYNGIWIMNSDGSKPVQVTSEAAAGWGFEWSLDSKSILSRVAKYENYRRYNAVKIFDIKSKIENQITDYRTFMPGLPHWIDYDENILVFGKKRHEKINSGKTIENIVKAEIPIQSCFLKGDKIAIYNNTSQEITSLDPLSGSGYLNPSISKDGTKIAFEVYGGNLYYMELDGSNLVDLGVGFTPKWSPDSKKLIYTYSQDDGHQFISSDIYILNIETMEKTNVTNTAEKLEMHPNWSPDGKSIVFDESISGIIYLLEL